MRSLWAISLAVRLIALIVGLRWRAPLEWLQWAGASLAIGFLLRWLDHRHLGAYYAGTWMVDQVLVTALLMVLFWREIRPGLAALAFSALVPAVIWWSFAGSRHWPGSMFEPVIRGTGLLTLWMGAAAIIETATEVSVRRVILSLYLLLSALLVIVIPEYIGGDGVSRGACALDIAAYGAWAVVWRGPGWRRGTKDPVRATAISNSLS